LRKLEVGNRHEAERACRKLVRIGSPAVEKLILALKKSPEVAERAAQALTTMEDPRGIEPLIALLDEWNAEFMSHHWLLDESSVTRWANVVKYVGRYKDPRGVETLIATMRAADEIATDRLYTRLALKALKAARDSVVAIGRPAVEPLIAFVKNNVFTKK
jgi:HEAT repeat protein